MTFSKSTKALIKVSASLLLLFYLFKSVELELILKDIQKIRIDLVILSLIIIFVGLLFTSLRFYFLVKDFGGDLNYLLMLKYCLIGNFFNNILPGGIGGDIVRIYKICKHNINPVYSTYATIIEKLTGLLSLSLLVSIVMLTSKNNIWENSNIKSLIYGLVIGIAIIFTVIFSRIYRYLYRLKLLNRAIEALDHTKLSTIVISLTISLPYQFLVLVFNLIVARSVGINLSISILFPAILFSILLVTIPISYQGIGIRENILVFLLTPFGINKETIVIFGVLSLSLNIIASSVGGMLFAIDKKYQ